MSLRLTETFEVSITGAAALGIGTVFVIRALFLNTRSSNAPLVGQTGIIAGFKSLLSGHRLIREGYEQHKPGMFLVRQMGYGEVVMITNEKMREEARKLPSDVASSFLATTSIIESKYTLGSDVLENPFHIGLVTTRLTKNLEAIFPEMFDELLLSCEDELPVKDDGSWSALSIGDPLKRIVSRTSNRILVGLPLCRNPEWRDLQISFTIATMADAMMIKMFPNFMKPWIGRYLAQGPKQAKDSLRLLSPLITERLSMSPEDRPNDFLTWLIEEAEKHPGEMDYGKLNRRMLIINFGAIHTTSLTAQGVIYDLASRPEYIEPLREEVEEMTQRHGWTKKAVMGMKKLDSFIRESQRMVGLGFMGSPRIMMQDHTFSDGTFVRKGTWVAAPIEAIHKDDANYENGSQFDGFRFSRLPDHENACNQIVSTSQIALAFGTGPHACPGRFFSANEIKTLVAHLLVTYDIKMKDEGIRPAPKRIGMHNVEDDSAQVCFRKRL